MMISVFQEGDYNILMSPRQKIDSSLYIALLAFFIDKPSHGYEIYKFLESEIAFFKIWLLKRSQFYSYLDRLYSEGFLSQQIEEGTQYPDRRIFSITVFGKEKLEEWLISPVQHGREMRQDFLIKLYISQKFFPDEIPLLVNNQRNTCQQWIIGQETQLTMEKDQIQFFLINYRKMQIQSMIDWLNLIEDNLKKIS